MQITKESPDVPQAEALAQSIERAKLEFAGKNAAAITEPNREEDHKPADAAEPMQTDEKVHAQKVEKPPQSGDSIMMDTNATIAIPGLHGKLDYLLIDNAGSLNSGPHYSDIY